LKKVVAAVPVEEGEGEAQPAAAGVAAAADWYSHRLLVEFPCSLGMTMST